MSNIDRHMCSKSCPCFSGFVETQAKELVQTIPSLTAASQDKDRPVTDPDDEKHVKLHDLHRNKVLWTGYMGAPESHFNKFMRTRGNKHIVEGNDILYHPMIWADHKFDSEGKQISFSTFQECLKQVLIPSELLTRGKSEKEAREIKKFFSDDGLFTYLTQLEKDFSCSSFCKPNLFYITKDISEGRPTQECVSASADAWGASRTYADYGKIGAIMSLTTGGILLLSMMCSCPLCGSFGDNERRNRKYQYKENYI